MMAGMATSKVGLSFAFKVVKKRNTSSLQLQCGTLLLMYGVLLSHFSASTFMQTIFLMVYCLQDDAHPTFSLPAKQ